MKRVDLENFQRTANAVGEQVKALIDSSNQALISSENDSTAASNELREALIHNRNYLKSFKDSVEEIVSTVDYQLSLVSEAVTE